MSALANKLSSSYHERSLRGMGLRFFLVLWIAMGCVNSGSVWAKKRADSRSDIQYAQEMIQKGRSLLKNKNYRAAISYFERSQARVPEVNNLFTIGAIYTKLRDCPQALKYWEAAQLMCGRCALSAKLERAILKHTDSCSTELSVQSIPRAQVLIDGERVGITPHLGRILHGTHMIQLIANGYKSESIRIQADQGRAVNVDLTLHMIGSLAGTPTTQRPLTQYPTQARPHLARPIEIREGVGLPAETWLATEKAAAKRHSSNTAWRRGLQITGVIMGVSSAALFGYTQYKYNQLNEKSKSSRTSNVALFNEAQSAGNLQAASRVLAGTALVSIISSLLLMD